MCSTAAIFSMGESLIISKKVSILYNIIRKTEKNWKIKNWGKKHVLFWELFPKIRDGHLKISMSEKEISVMLVYEFLCWQKNVVQYLIRLKLCQGLTI
jgi:hypothetical protein